MSSCLPMACRGFLRREVCRVCFNSRSFSQSSDVLRFSKHTSGISKKTSGQQFKRMDFRYCSLSSPNFSRSCNIDVMRKNGYVCSNLNHSDIQIRRALWMSHHEKQLSNLIELEDTNSLLDSISEESVKRSEFAMEVSQYLERLHTLAYNNLSHLPWIHLHNPSLSYMQLLMNDKLGEEMSSIHKHKNFNVLLNWLEKNCASLTTDDLTRCLVITLWLGVERSLPSVTAMFIETHDRIHSMSLSSMVDLTDALRSLARTDLKMIEGLIPNLLHLLDTLDPKSMTEEDFLHVCRFVSNVWNFVNDRVASEAAMFLEKCLSQMDKIDDVAVFSTYCRLVKRFKGRNIPIDKIYLEKVYQKVVGNKDKLSPAHIAEIAHSLKSCGMYPADLASILHDRSLQLLKSNTLTKVAEVTNVCYSFNKNLSGVNRHLIEENLYRHMKEADVLVLSNIADVLVNIDCKNADIIQVFVHMVLKHKAHILNFVTRLSKILRFLNQSQCIRISQNEELFEAIYQQLYQQQGVHVWSISHLAHFLLRHVNHVIPSKLYERLTAVIPQCEIAELYPIMVGLSRIGYPRVRTMQSQVQNLQALVYSNIMKQVKKISSLDMLNMMIITLVMRWEAKDLVLLDALMDQFPRFTKEMNENGFVKAVGMMNQLTYYSPRILEDLTKYLIENHKTMAIDRISTFLKMLATIGYLPSDGDLLGQISSQAYEESTNLLDIPSQLKYCLHLSIIQLFPENLINSIFSLEFIEDLDTFINGNADERYVVEKTFMELNRAVVLECPHLDVPWFHEQYCVDHPQTKQSSVNKKQEVFLSEVREVLEEILGGRRFYQQNCLSLHYHYPLDFECLLKGNGVAVPLNTTNIENSQELGFQRVAILTMNRQDYCRNLRRLIGPKQMMKRHLEIMGYKVVQIPIFDWASMALTEHAAKVDYLKEKISQK